MRRNTLFLFLLVSALSVHSMGIGVMGGSPTGLSLKFGRMHLGVGFSTFKGENFALHFSYEIPFKIDFGGGNVIPMYFGLGFYGQEATDFGMGIRVPVGVKFWLMRNLVLFGEVVPGYSFLPATDFVLFGAIGLRIHFQIRS